MPKDGADSLRGCGGTGCQDDVTGNPTRDVWHPTSRQSIPEKPFSESGCQFEPRAAEGSRGQQRAAGQR